MEHMRTVYLRLPQIVSHMRVWGTGGKSCGVTVCVLHSPPGRAPAAVVRSGTALVALDAALSASERTQAASGVGRRRRVLANMRREGVGFSEIFASATPARGYIV